MRKSRIRTIVKDPKANVVLDTFARELAEMSDDIIIKTGTSGEIGQLRAEREWSTYADNQIIALGDSQEFQDEVSDIITNTCVATQDAIYLREVMGNITTDEAGRLYEKYVSSDVRATFPSYDDFKHGHERRLIRKLQSFGIFFPEIYGKLQPER